MKITVISFTEAGGALNRRLCKSLNEIGLKAQGFEKKEIKESLNQWTRKAFSENDGLIFIGACGIAVRAIAPCVKDKFTDPAVVVLDEKAGFAVSLLSGHVGGANKLARIAAELTGAVPVISTATDVNGLFAVDVFAGENGLALSDRRLAKLISAGILSGKRIPFFMEQDAVRLMTDRESIPKELLLCETKEEFLGREGIKAAISVKRLSPLEDDNILYLIPKAVTLGVGCRRGTSFEALKEALDIRLSIEGVFKEAVERIATIDIKKDEEGLKKLAEELEVPFCWYGKDKLNRLEGEFSCSPFVKETVGVDSVCERSAVLGSGKGKLIMKKQAGNGITMAAALQKSEIEFEKE